MRPLLTCPHCGNENRSLARYCRGCSKRIPAQTPDISKSIRDLIAPQRLGEVRGKNPGTLTYGGFLWLISEQGELYQASGGAKQLFPCAKFPEGGFSFPLTIEIDDKNGPIIYANNHRGVFKYNVLAEKVDKLFEVADSNSRIVSGLIKRGLDFYYLTQESRAHSAVRLTLSSSDKKFSYPLAAVTLHGSLSSPLQRIGDDLWVITREKLLVFQNFSAAKPREFSWNPWRIWVTSKGILYSEKANTGVGGDTQSIWRLTFGEAGFEHYSLAEGLSLTARVATSEDGKAVIFTPSGIKVFDAALNSMAELTGIVQVHNPQAIQLSPPFIFWFETADRSIRAWTIGASRIFSLWSFTASVNFSQFLLTGSSLYGFTEEEVWRWGLLDT